VDPAIASEVEEKSKSWILVFYVTEYRKRPAPSAAKSIDSSCQGHAPPSFLITSLQASSCSMPRSITALVSCLLLILGAARAQISAPNCTDSSMNWVRYLRTLFCYINNKRSLSHIAGDFFEYSRSIRSNKVPAWSVHTCRPCAMIAVSASTFGISSASYRCLQHSTSLLCNPNSHYPGPTDGNLCNCNTVVYSLMSACGQCQDGGGPRCVGQLYFGLHSPRHSEKLT
jgi:hypothetical protein